MFSWFENFKTDGIFENEKLEDFSDVLESLKDEKFAKLKSEDMKTKQLHLRIQYRF